MFFIVGTSVTNQSTFHCYYFMPQSAKTTRNIRIWHHPINLTSAAWNICSVDGKHKPSSNPFLFVVVLAAVSQCGVADYRYPSLSFFPDDPLACTFPWLTVSMATKGEEDEAGAWQSTVRQTLQGRLGSSRGRRIPTGCDGESSTGTKLLILSSV